MAEVANLPVGAIQDGGIAMTAPLTPEQRLAVYDRHRAGESLASIAQDLGVHYETARKWWRVGRLQGRWQLADRPRKHPGRLRRVPPAVVERMRTLRRQHRDSWGVPYLRQQLLADPELTPAERAQVPSLATLYRYVRALEEREPRRPLRNQTPVAPLIGQTEYPHQLWQMDLKEKKGYAVDSSPDQGLCWGLWRTTPGPSWSSRLGLPPRRPAGRTWPPCVGRRGSGVRPVGRSRRGRRVAVCCTARRAGTRRR